MTELVQVKIKCTVVTSRYGTLSGGDLLRTDAEFAKHLVEDCGAGEYVVSSGGTAANADGQSASSAPAAPPQTLTGKALRQLRRLAGKD